MLHISEKFSKLQYFITLKLTYLYPEAYFLLQLLLIRIIKGTGRLGGRRMSGDHRNNNIIENGPGGLRRLAVIRTPVKDHQLKLV